MEARPRSTARLRLVAATPAIARADLESRIALQNALGVVVPENWPPQYYDAAAIATSLQWLESHPDESAWTTYYIVRTDLPAPQLAGIIGYRGAPSAKGTVEIGYSLLTQHQRLGLATEAADALVAAAFEDPRVRCVIAETLPELEGSIRVLEKLGFRFSGDGSEPGVIRFALPRPHEESFLRTQRLEFRCWRMEDLPLAVALWGDPAVSRWITAGGSFTSAQVEQRLQEEIAQQATHGMQYWPVFRRDDGTHVGCCGLRPNDAGARLYELGVHLRAAFWGQGYAAEACRAVIDHAFARRGAAGLFAGHHPENTASERLLCSLGFRFTHRELYAPTGLEHPSYRLDPPAELDLGAI